MGSGDTDHVVPQILHERLEIHRNECLVLDDQHVGGDLGRHFAAGGVREAARLGHVGAQNESDFFFREALQRQQQKGLARQRGDVGKPALRGQRQRGHLGIVVDRDRIPYLRE